uniref:Uncharacterized protein LOC114343640 n=1 Tax=Diabrotica virgifera virgifera TaxID=50390 RepID=A0A6P7GXX7_DIAVI
MTEQSAKIAECKKQTHNPFSSLKTKLCSAHLPKPSCFSKIAVNKTIDRLDESKTSNKQFSSNSEQKHYDSTKAKQKEDGDKKYVIISECKSEKQSPKKHHKTCRKSIFSKSTGFLVEEQKKASRGLSSNLRIKICDSPLSNTEYFLETDSSNEYESETGIPKSPTLFISGVSISRTPEPKSTGVNFIQAGRSSRSSSFSIPLPLSSCSLNISSTSLNNYSSLPPEPYTPSLVKSCTPITSRSNLQTPSTSPSRSITENGKTRSANEPEREREMFRFPKSSTDGALSSVLHVQESNLSSDDFHEALFLLERSQVRDSKRRKKSKKREKGEKGEKGEKDEKKEDQSSVL